MSKVNLSGVLYYDGDEQRRPVEKQIALEGIDKLFPSVRFPQKGMTFLYGHRNNAVPYLLDLGGHLKKDAVVIEVHVEIGKWLRQKVDLSSGEESGLSHTRFLNINRAKRDLVDRISDVWVKHLDPSADPEWPKGATLNPWILDHLIEGAEFRHLAVIAYQVKTAEVGVFQCATIFDFDAVETIDGGWRLMETDMVLQEH